MKTYDELLEANKKWGVFFGVWSNGKRKILEKLQVVAIFIILTLSFLSSIANFIKCRGDLNCMMDTLTHLSIIGGSIYIFIAYLSEENVYRAAIDDLYKLRDEYQTIDNTREMEKLARFRITIVYMFYNVGVGCYGFVPLLTYNYCLQHPNPFNQFDVCGLPMPAWYPYNVTASPNYEITWAFQTLAGLFITHGIGQPVAILWCILMHTIVHMRVLKESLKNIQSKCEDKRFEILQHCVKYHTSIIEFINPVLNSGNRLLFLNTIFMQVILTATGFELIKFIIAFDIWNAVKYIMVLIGGCMVFITNSVIGQILIDESWEIMDYAYDIEWYGESVQFQKMILLMMLRANQPIVLKNASLTENSLSNMNKLFSSVYSYITFLLNYLE